MPKSVALFSFLSDAVPPTAMVAGFRGVEGISRLYRVAVGLLTAGNLEIDIAAARGAAASLMIEPGGAPMPIHGRIASMRLMHCWQGQSLYEAVLVPDVWRLTLGEQSRVFVGMTVPEIVEQVLLDSGIAAADFELALQAKYPKRLHVCQYHESRWSFVARLMEREGIYFFFDHDDGREKLVITDHRSYHALSRDKPVRYVPLAGPEDGMSDDAFQSFACEQASLPKTVRVRDFDHLNPLLEVVGDAPVWGPAQADRKLYGGFGGSLTEAEAKQAANVHAESWLAQELVYQGVARAFPIRSGYRFLVDEHPLASMNGDYLATEVHHYGRQAAVSELVRDLLGLAHEDDYRATVTAIPHATQFRPPQSVDTPRIYGLERGFVDGPADSPYAQIDEHGRYKVKLHFDFDDSDLKDGKASTWIRMLQPHAGDVEGFHFPLRKGTEVVVAFLGGDPDRPVIVGSVPNTVTPSPVTSDNYTQNVVQTGGSNRIELEDVEGGQYVDISTPPEGTYVHLGQPHGGHSHNIVFNTGGTQFVNIGGNRDIEVGGTLVEHVAGHVSWTHDSGRADTVTGGVFEKYSAVHDTLVSGTRNEVVTGAVTEQYATQTTTVSGAVTETYGTQSTTVAGSLSYQAANTSMTFANTTMTFANTSLTFGPTSVSWGPTSGNIASLTLDVGPVNINTPSWKVTNPDETWLGAVSTWSWGKKASFVGFSMSATGLSISLTGAKISNQGINLVSRGAKVETGGAKVSTNGARAEQGGIKSVLKGLVSFA